MRKFIILTYLLFLSIIYLSANSKFGNATIEELSLTSYPADSTASAIILLKEGETRFIYNENDGFQFEFTVQAKIKILTTEGLEWCNQEIDYTEVSNSSKEKIKSLSGTTYNLENGKVVKTKLSREYMFDENVNNKLKRRKFTMPAAKVGSVIEFKYTIISDFFYDLRDFSFQHSDPVLYSKYEIVIPEYFKYNVNMQGYEFIKSDITPHHENFFIRYRDSNGMVRSESVRANAEKYVFVANDIPALKNEEYVWCRDDFVSKVTFELRSVQYPYQSVQTFSSSWANIDKELLNTSSFGGNLKREGLFKDLVTKKETNLENAREILNQVKSLVRYNDKSTFFSSNLQQALKDGVGTSADMNFLLINALKAGGYNAYPVVMSTRKNGVLPLAHPSISALNYVITAVKIGDDLFFTDASSSYGDWNLLSYNCMVEKARLISDNQLDWVDLSGISSAVVAKNAESYFEGGKFITKIADVRRGNAAFEFRYSYNQMKNQEEYVEKISAGLQRTVGDFQLSGMESNHEDIKLEYTLSSDVSVEDEYIYINPMLEKHFTDNPFKGEERKLPVNFNYKSGYIQNSTIIIPEGYMIDELPKTEKITSPDNSLVFVYGLAQMEEKVILQYSFRCNKLLFLPDEYEMLRDFFSRLVMKNSEQIVLKKI